MATTSLNDGRAAKEKTNARKKRRRKKRIIATLIVMLFIGLITVGVLSVTVLFKIEIINVAGSTTYTAEEIVSAADISVGDNLILASKSNIEEKLIKDLPFIDGVTVEKQFPGVLNIKVNETTETICFENSSGCFSANNKGKILKKYSTVKEDLILVTISDNVALSEGEYVSFSEDREKELFDNFSKILEKNEFKVDFINMSDPFSSYMKIDGRIIAKLGSSSYFDNKVAYLKASLDGVSKQAEGVFDLSAWTPENNRPVLTYGDISSYEK